jgi:1-aminocyclopropane-1-carboxylate deaminase
VFYLPSPLQLIDDCYFTEAGIELYLKRDDLIHPQISGNKWRKLKYNIEEAQKLQKNAILTFGGAFSNHIYATAATGKAFGIKTIGMIRGDEILPLNPTLSFAESQGMKLYFLNRTDYRSKETAEILDRIKEMVQEDFFLIPEGGANDAGIKGCSEITAEITIDFDYICCPCGTGTTFQGLAQSLKPHQQALGFLALKIPENSFMPVTANGQLFYDYHFGGYAKTKPELISFIHQFEATHSILLEQVYTGKMMFGIYDLLQKGFFKAGQKVVVLHTGGLQGRNL